MIYTNLVRLLSLLVGCLYPSYSSYKILNSQKRRDEDLYMWMSYWIVYGIFVLFDFLTAALVAIIPFLNEVKLLFLFWLLPNVGGGNQVIYEEFLRSFFSSHELSIDQVLIHATLTGGNLVGQLISSILGHLMAVADSYLLSRGHRPALQITPSMEDIVNDVIAKRQLKEKRKQMENLSDTIDEVLSDNPIRKSTLSSLDLLNESESGFLVAKDHGFTTKEKPETPPKPMRQLIPSNKEIPKLDENQEQNLK
ncbi:uncharacterized protein T19C3.4 [Drosophila ficusphila]|uniref:uncharacterized protein T19C3.4 n=1 Tax=Drosophila ficusphila TaxID=30025 RepID=UPI0007E81FD6|nr:uncharacterized protein T19C3.4 [Drosophila ficusphila]